MKAGIVTIQSLNNGNRLQNYALQRVLTDEGFKTESIRREPFNAMKRLKGTLRRVIKNDSVNRFRAFDSEFIHFSKYTLSTQFITPGFSDAYDAYVIGSDQVWNPDFSFSSELEYLPMVEPSKKVAYAASFGVREIKAGCIRTAELLSGIPSISVRENAGAKIILDLTGREVPVVLDPTMLLTTENWSFVSKKPDIATCNTPFAVKCVLGDDASGSRIDSIASKYGLNIIDINDPLLRIGPSEFVWLISHSELVCTDSFHASVFALLHHKPLAIFERVSANADMSSRFDTLCSNFGLVGNRSSEPSFGENAIFGTDWNDVDNRLFALRKSSLYWLKSSLEGVARG